MLPARLVGRAEARVAVVVTLVRVEAAEAQGPPPEPHPALGRDPAGAQRLVMLGEGLLVESVDEGGPPQPASTAECGTAQLAARFGHALGRAPEEGPPLQGFGKVLRLESSPRATQVGGSAETGFRSAEGQTHLDPGCPDAHVGLRGAGGERVEGVHVGIGEGRPQGGGIGHLHPVEGPGGTRPRVALGEEERLLLAVRAADVHAVDHDSGHVAEDRPGVGRAGTARSSSASNTVMAPGPALADASSRRVLGTCDRAMDASSLAHPHGDDGGASGAGLQPIGARRQVREDGPPSLVGLGFAREPRGLEPEAAGGAPSTSRLAVASWPRSTRTWSRTRARPRTVTLRRDTG